MTVLTALILLLQPDPRLVEHVKAGLAARQAGQLDRAARELQAAAKLAPSLAEIQLNLGLVQHERQDFAAAVAAFEQALAAKPALTGVRDLMGFDLLQLGRVQQAVQTLERALEENPANNEARAWLGLANLEAGDYRAAARHLETALASKPSDPDLLFYLTRVYDRLGAEARQRLLDAAPDSARAHMAAAEFAAFNGRSTEAIEEYRKAQASAPKLPGIAGAIAELLANDSKFDEAAASYRQELALNPGNARTQYRYGLVLGQLGRPKEAIGYLGQAVAGDPSLHDARFQLGKLLLTAGDLAAAERELLAVSAAPVSNEMLSAAAYQLAALYRKQGEAAKAAEQLRRFEALKK
ncbi:MAG: tetratricopeptide repeat protein [Acidobacteria bacterium]|nr:tetratricopeptide repeat protein [Acidobacteriota bacterium]